MELTVMFDGVLSDGERERLRKIKADATELHLLAETRIIVRTRSLEDSNKRLREARDRNDAARIAYENGMIVNAEDEDDDYVTELDKRETREKIEEEYITAGREYRNALQRAGWELREADKWGGLGQK
jgi:hypothetical protein